MGYLSVADKDLGAGLPVEGIDLGQAVDLDAALTADVEGGPGDCGLLCPLPGKFHPVQNVHRITVKVAPGVGQDDMPLDPLKQGNAQLCFQQLNLAGDGGLGDIQLLGGPTEVEVFGDGGKTPQLL